MSASRLPVFCTESVKNEEGVRVGFFAIADMVCAPPPPPPPPLNPLQQDHSPGKIRGRPWVGHSQTPRLRNCKQLPLFKMLPHPTCTHTNRHPQPPAFSQWLTYRISCMGRKRHSLRSGSVRVWRNIKGPMLEVWGTF